MLGGEFDGNAAFAGGGFMPSQATTLAPDSASVLNKNREVRTLLPLTLKQLNSVSINGDSNFSIDGVDINTVAVVGRVSRMENRITQVDFVVDDGTGCIDCIRWCHERQETEEIEAVRLGMYVRLHGHLKSFQGKRSVNVFSIRPVTDFNEIVHHFSECIYVHMYKTKSRGQGGSITQATGTPRSQMPYSTVPTPAKPYQTGPSNQGQGGSVTPSPQMAYSTMPTPAKPYQTGPSNQFPNQFNDPMYGVTQTVLDYLNQPKHLTSEARVDCDVIARELRIPPLKVRDVLEQLSNDGCVYSTSDETFYKSTANV